MRIYIADTGLLVGTLTLQVQDSISQLARWIEKQCGLAVDFQILMTSMGQPLRLDRSLGESMDASMSFLDDEEFTIYVFDRRLLELDSESYFSQQSSDLMEHTLSGSLLLPNITDDGGRVRERLSRLKQSVSSAAPEELDTAYLNVFAADRQLSSQYYASIQTHAARCKELVIAVQHQLIALNVALKNLQTHSRAVSDAWLSFEAHFKTETKRFRSLLDGLPDDLKLLQSIQVHPHLAPAGVKTLYDLTEYNSVKQTEADCESRLEAIQFDCETLRRLIVVIEENIQKEEDNRPETNIRELEEVLAELEPIKSKAHDVAQMFGKDLVDVKTALQGARDIEASHLKLDDVLRKHLTQNIPELLRGDAALRNAVSYLSEAHLRNRNLFVIRLRNISQHQSLIAEVSPQLQHAAQNLKGASQRFAKLLAIHRMPTAWIATLIEIVRRREFRKAYIHKINDLAELVSNFYEKECRTRETFKREILSYIPEGLIPGVEAMPPICTIDVTNVAEELPHVTRQNIEEFSLKLKDLKRNAGSSMRKGITALQATISSFLPKVDHFDFDFLRDFQNIEVDESSGTNGKSPLKPFDRSLEPTGNSFTSASREISKTSSSTSALSNNINLTNENLIKNYVKRIESLEAILKENFTNTHLPEIGRSSGSNGTEPDANVELIGPIPRPSDSELSNMVQSGSRDTSKGKQKADDDSLVRLQDFIAQWDQLSDPKLLTGYNFLHEKNRKHVDHMFGMFQMNEKLVQDLMSLSSLMSKLKIGMIPLVTNEDIASRLRSIQTELTVGNMIDKQNDVKSWINEMHTFVQILIEACQKLNVRPDNHIHITHKNFHAGDIVAVAHVPKIGNWVVLCTESELYVIDESCTNSLVGPTFFQVESVRKTADPETEITTDYVHARIFGKPLTLRSRRSSFREATRAIPSVSLTSVVSESFSPNLDSGRLISSGSLQKVYNRSEHNLVSSDGDWHMKSEQSGIHNSLSTSIGSSSKKRPKLSPKSWFF